MVTDVLQRPRQRTRRRRRTKPGLRRRPYPIPPSFLPPTAPTASGTNRWLGGDTADGGGAPNQRIAPPGAGVLTNEKRMKGGGRDPRVRAS